MRFNHASGKRGSAHWKSASQLRRVLHLSPQLHGVNKLRRAVSKPEVVANSLQKRTLVAQG
jgi:hypothetical protein